MTETIAEESSAAIAAIIYRGEDDVDALLLEFAFAQRAAGDRIGGVVQKNIKDATGRRVDMQLIDLIGGDAIGISQTLGAAAASCKLDTAGLADSAHAVTRAIESGTELVIINKFAKQEATGKGLRSEFADAILSGKPLLTAVPEKCAEDWRAFTGGAGIELHCSRTEIDAWWRDVQTAALRAGDAAAFSTVG
jgi:nucleoside-triphosphatase THEP1